MIRPLNRVQLAARALQHTNVNDLPPNDSALVERVKLLERENLRLHQEASNSINALTESEERVGKLDQQCLELTRVRSPREDQKAKIAELEQQVASLDAEKAALAKQVFDLSAEPKTAPTALTLITILDISEDKKGSDGSLSARVKLDDTEVDVFVTSSLDTARKLLRRVKEA